ncbi:hypothetical protein D3C81_2040140 [compost metagenome]
MDKFAIFWRHAPVIYVNRETHINGKEDINLNRLLNTMEYTSFIKPKTYEQEKEYRFIYLIQSEKGLELLKKDTMIVEASEALLSKVFIS